MEKRYIPNAPFSAMDKKGRRRLYVADFRRQDGTIGYTEPEVADLYAAQLKSFRIIEVGLPGVVEQATAAPGEKRSVKLSK